MLSVAAGLFWPAAAQAQTYVVPVCNTGSAPAGMAGWHTWPGYEEGAFNTCDVGGAFGGYQPLDPQKFPYWEWTAPGDVRLKTLRVWRPLTLAPAGNYQLFAGGDNRELESEQNRPLANPAEFTGLNASDVTFTVYCNDPNLACGNSPTENRVTFTRMEMVFEDKVAPRAVGALTATASGYATDFTDIGGGVREAVMVVDGADVSRAATCPQPYTSAVPCPLSGRGEVALNTRALANGTHRVQLGLIDVAGNRTLTDAVNVEVDNPVESVPVATARPGRIVPARTSVRGRYNRASEIAALLADPSGAPIAGATVAVAMRTNVRGSSYAAATPAVTDARGRVTLKVPKGPSRVVRLTYGDSTATVTVKVKAPLRLKVSPKRTRNRGVVRLTGSVAGTKLPTRIELQAYSGGHWFPFKTVALRKGKFSGRYRFTRTFSSQRYRFRAVVHADRDFPYGAATSPVVAVRVRP